MNPDRLPIAIELFAQWRNARGEQSAPASRPFSRNWDKLLEDAGLLSALDRSEAERDARSLAEAGWLELKCVRYRPHLIERVIIPLSSESRWMQAFNFQPPSDAEEQAIKEFP